MEACTINPYKTYLIIIGTMQQRNRVVNHVPVKLLGNDISPSCTVPNLGVVFNSKFNFRQQIYQECNSCFHHIRDIRLIRRHTSLSTTKTTQTALIYSSLDYCNSLQKLPKQSCLARVVLGAPRFSPYTFTLASSYLSNQI